jgi:hypothetical protein
MWVDPSDCNPPHSLDMDSKHDYEKVAMLREAFDKNGFDKKKAALVGYPLDGKIQLMSGTHRHYAASQIGMKLPVTIWLRSDIEESWGTDEWNNKIADIPVCELETWQVKDGALRTQYPAIDISKEYTEDD